MGAGIAKTIKSRFPKAYEADCKTEKGSREKLGSYLKATVGECTIVNAYTQFHWRGKGNKVDYKAIRSVFQLIKKEFAGKRIVFSPGYEKRTQKWVRFHNITVCN